MQAAVCVASGHQSTPAMVLSGDDSIIVSWYDYSLMQTDYSIKAQKITDSQSPITTTVPATTTTPFVTTTTTTVSTACPSEVLYGEDSEEVELLRCFRDNVLSKTQEGQEIIRLYYEWSPVIVKTLKEDKGFREGVKEIIKVSFKTAIYT